MKLNKKFLPISVFFVFFMIIVASFSTCFAQGVVIPSNTGLPDGTVVSVLNRSLNWLLMVFVIIAVISFVITGLQFIFSFGGASGSEAQAKKNFTYTIIAIFIVGGSLIILSTIVKLLGPSSGGGGGNITGTNYGTEENPNYGTIDDNYEAVNPNNTQQNQSPTPPLTTQPTYTPGEGTAPYSTPSTPQQSPAIPPNWPQVTTGQ